MANALFDFGRESFLDANVDWSANDIKLVFTDHGVDTPVPATDQFLSDISTATIATSGNFAGKTSTGGTADANDVTVSTVSGAQFESVNIFYDTAVAATSILIVFIDTATGLPLTPNGGDITVVWDSGADRIFTL